MHKLKPHKGLLKRVKVSAKGKIIRHKANRGHLMTSKTGKRRRQLGSPAVIDNAQIEKKLRRLLRMQ